MILEIKRLIAKAQYSGDFSYDFTPEKNSLLVPLCKVDTVKVEGSYEIYDDDSVEIALKLSYTLYGQCSYCLGDAKEDIVYKTEALFVPDGVKDEEYPYDGVRLDLTAAVNDAFMISQPNVLLCKSDCKGIKLS